MTGKATGMQGRKRGAGAAGQPRRAAIARCARGASAAAAKFRANAIAASPRSTAAAARAYALAASRRAASESGEGFIDVLVKMLIVVVVGAVLLSIMRTAVPQLFSDMIDKIRSVFEL
jgi:hypothetical protein